MLEVASVAVGAITLLAEAEAGLGLIGGVDVLVTSQLLRPVRELTSLSVGTEALCGEVLAERAFDLGTALVRYCWKVDGGSQDEGL